MTKMDKEYIEKEYEQAIKFYTMYQKAQDNFILGFCHH